MGIGKRIYYDVGSGNIIVDTGERQGNVFPTTIEEEIVIYKELTERNRASFDYIELDFRQYAQDFAESDSYRVNPQTRMLEFSYPNPNEPEIIQPYRHPLSEEVEQLKQEDLNNKEAIAELYILSMGGF